ncbi:MAG TPA: hypothetical protein DDW49_11700 [Deltaproteobacteria bacterium]|nr:MAG: hypothetical protein A2048_05290 [Deltaproteobacteria bacterium GWA2_45_12]HBF14031.1 hypothetical protein [Deltaproteobacteria bacterium]
MLTEKDILKLFDFLNDELKKKSIKGEVCLVGGAVMCLVFKERPSTHDVDGYFEPATHLREAAKKVGLKAGFSENWLNDGVKGFLSPKGKFQNYLELSHLKIFTAKPDYLLAMKCLAMRIGEEFHDLDDIRYLLRFCNITDYKEALNIVTQFYPLERFPQKTLYALEELLGKK